MKKILSLIFSLLAYTTAYAELTYMVMSDMHVMERSLFQTDGVEGESFAAYKPGEPKLVELSQSLFDRAITQIKNRRPQLLLIPGDLSKDGEKVSHEYVASELNKLVDAGIKVLVVPGNHDVGNPNAYSYTGASAQKAESVTSEEFSTLYNRCGYADAVAQNGLSYVAYPYDGLAVLCLDSRKPDTQTTHYSQGGLTEETLAWAELQARRARMLGRTVIGIMHHPIVEHFDQHAAMAPAYIANQNEDLPPLQEVQERLVACGVGLMFTGHYHLQSIQHETILEEGTTNEKGQLWDVMTGSLSAYPLSIRYGSLDLSNGSLKVQSLTIRTDEELTLAKQRNENTTHQMFGALAHRMLPKFNAIKAMIGSTMVNWPTTEGQIVSGMEPYMCAAYSDLFNTLARGDEEQDSPETKAQVCLDAFDNYAKSLAKSSAYTSMIVKAMHQLEEYTTLQQMINSILYNYRGDATNTMADNDNTNTQTLARNLATLVPLTLADLNHDGQKDHLDIIQLCVNALLGYPIYEPWRQAIDLNRDGQFSVGEFSLIIELYR